MYSEWAGEIVGCAIVVVVTFVVAALIIGFFIGKVI